MTHSNTGKGFYFKKKLKKTSAYRARNINLNTVKESQ